MVIKSGLVRSIALAGTISVFGLACDVAPEWLGETGITLPENFAAAEESTGVPAEILMAVARAETSFQMVAGDEEFPGQERAYGWMGLREKLVQQGADLAGITVDEAKFDPQGNIDAAAALLSERADQLGIDRSELRNWGPVVADYSGISDDEAVSEYVHYEVYGALQRGFALEGFDFEPIAIEPDWPRPARWGQRSGDGGAIWTPSPNNSSRSGASVDYVVIHTCEGSYSGCWGWLTNGASGVSAHYVVNDSGSEVRQLVDEDRKAWHISANYDCANNGGTECWRDGTAMNSVSVGIEHAGYASQTTWNPGLISRSSELTCGITQRHGIPRDSYHIVGHGQLQPWNRTDPGANWPWSDYLSQVDVECGGGGGGGGGGATVPPAGGGSQIVIDSNNAANDVASYYIELSGNWWSSANVGGYYNTGYWVAPTDSTSDPASFWFYDSSDQCYTVEAWWTAAWDRPSSITYLGWDEADNEVGRMTVNQQGDGGQWNHLGDWRFGTGWNRVLLSRWASAGSYVVADAVRLTPSAACP